jgi:hypothetical protein
MAMVLGMVFGIPIGAGVAAATGKKDADHAD